MNPARVQGKTNMDYNYLQIVSTRAEYIIRWRWSLRKSKKSWWDRAILEPNPIRNLAHSLTHWLSVPWGKMCTEISRKLSVSIVMDKQFPGSKRAWWDTPWRTWARHDLFDKFSALRGGADGWARSICWHHKMVFVLGCMQLAGILCLLAIVPSAS